MNSINLNFNPLESKLIFYISIDDIDDQGFNVTDTSLLIHIEYNYYIALLHTLNKYNGEVTWNFGIMDLTKGDEPEILEEYEPETGSNINDQAFLDIQYILINNYEILKDKAIPLNQIIGSDAVEESDINFHKLQAYHLAMIRNTNLDIIESL